MIRTLLLIITLITPLSAFAGGDLDIHSQQQYAPAPMKKTDQQLLDVQNTIDNIGKQILRSRIEQRMNGQEDSSIQQLNTQRYNNIIRILGNYIDTRHPELQYLKNENGEIITDPDNKKYIENLRRKEKRSEIMSEMLRESSSRVFQSF